MTMTNRRDARGNAAIVWSPSRRTIAGQTPSAIDSRRYGNNNIDFEYVVTSLWVQQESVTDASECQRLCDFAIPDKCNRLW